MKKLVLFIIFILSLSALYAQTIDVIHLKNGFDARGTITNRTESQITLQSENGRSLTIDLSEIESMEQEQKVFDPRVLIGRWACYKANGERDRRYDIVINENEGFYSVSYDSFIRYTSEDGRVCGTIQSDCTPTNVVRQSKDIDVSEGIVSYLFKQYEDSWIHANTKKEFTAHLEQRECEINLKYTDGKLKGNIDCSWLFIAWGTSGYRFVEDALDTGHGSVEFDGYGGKWNVYFVKY